MQDLSMEGVGKISGGEFGKISVDGVGTCSGNMKAQSIVIDGVLKCSGSVQTGLLDVDGVADITADVSAKTIDVDGVLNVKGMGKIEAEYVKCDGVIKADGEISADVIDADGCISAKEIVGDKIKIKTHMHHRLFRFFYKDTSNINLIEATIIELKGVRARSVNGKDIIIGPHCIIDTIDCNGTLYIDPSATIGRVTGNYTLR